LAVIENSSRLITIDVDWASLQKSELKAAASRRKKNPRRWRRWGKRFWITTLNYQSNYY
jgi:hypothetical protein